MTKEVFMSLEKEQALFKKEKNTFLKSHKGQFVLIKGKKVHGFFPTEEKAFEKGLELFGIEDMFIKQVLKEEPKTFVPAFSVKPDARL